MTHPSAGHATEPELEPGTLLAGRYRIDELIGRGGMGAVYRATQLGLFRAVAVKVVHASYAQSERYRQRFEREARVMASLDHPNVAAVYDFGAHDNTLFLTMELLLGEPLSDQLQRRGPISVAEACRIGLVITDVLRTAHAIRLVHRDLKPENLFVLDDGTLKVVDFGLAFIDDAADLGRMTQANIVAGTPTHMAPEQAAGRPLGPACDMYALGIMLFEFVAGTTPFVGPSGDVLAKHIYTPAPSIASVLGLPVDPAYEELVARLLKKFADARPTADEAHEALRAILRHEHAPMAQSRLERALPPVPAVTMPMGAMPMGAMPMGTMPMGTMPMGTFVAAVVEEFRVYSEQGLSPDEQSALAACGLATTDDIHAAHVAICRYPTPQDVARLRESINAVVARIDPLDIDGVTALLRAGVSDVIPQLAAPSDLAKKLRQACERANRRGVETSHAAKG